MSEVHSPVLYPRDATRRKRPRARKGRFIFNHADDRFIDRPVIGANHRFLSSFRYYLLFSRLHFKTSLIYLLCDIGGCYFRPADETNDRHGSTHTNDILISHHPRLSSGSCASNIEPGEVFSVKILPLFRTPFKAQQREAGVQGSPKWNPPPTCM